MTIQNQDTNEIGRIKHAALCAYRLQLISEADAMAASGIKTACHQYNGLLRRRDAAILSIELGVDVEFSRDFIKQLDAWMDALRPKADAEEEAAINEADARSHAAFCDAAYGETA